MSLTLNSFHRYFLILFFALGTILVAGRLRRDFSPNEISILKTLPNVALESADGNVLSSHDFLNSSRPIMVHFWGTWCAPCEAEFPELIKLVNSLDESKLTVLLVAANDEKAKVLKFLKKLEFKKNVQIVMDPKGEAMKRFGTVKVPETYFFDSNGKIVRKFVGPQRWSDESYRRYLIESLGLF